MDESVLIGKTIKYIQIDGHGIVLITEDGLILTYDSSDGGYSTYDISIYKT